MKFLRRRRLPLRRNSNAVRTTIQRLARPLACEPLEDRRLLAVVINEIMYHPATELVVEEFVELHNTGASQVELLGWRLAGVDFVFPDVSIAPGDYLVVAADVAAFNAKYPGVPNVVGGWGGRLSNQGERLQLRSDSDTLADEVTYADDGDWGVRRRGPDDRGHQGWVWEADHDGLGSSLELINPAMPNEHGRNWSSSITVEGTPGAPNSVLSVNVAPLIVETIHAPIIPTSNDSVTVTTRVVDESAVGVSVTLWHRADDAEPFAPETMFDDGAHGDGAAGDRLYGAILPARPDGTVVEFYVSAMDAGGLERTWPGPTDEIGTQGANLLYQVSDARPAAGLPTYQVIMTETERAELEGINRFSDAQMNASFVTTVAGQTEVRYNVGVRIRGSGSRTTNPPNYRVNVPADRPWQDVTQLNLNTVGTDQQVAGSALFAMAGLPAADALPVTVLTNGVDLMGGGFYAHVEVLNSAWADHHFPTDGAGNVYRGRRPNESPPGGQGAGLVYFGPDPAPYASYVKTSNASEADWSDVINLTIALNETPDASYIEAVSQVADIDQWLRLLALNALIDNNEFSLFNGDRLGDDYAMYRGIEDPRFLLVPHDLDTLFRNSNRGLFRERGVPALNRLVTHPEIVPRYYAQFVDLIENLMTPEKLEPVLTAALGQMVDGARIQQIQDFLVIRGEVVMSRIPRVLTALTDLPIADGLPRTDGVPGLLSGQAGVLDADKVLVNGVEAQWSPFDAAWQINVVTGLGAEEVIVPAGAVWKYLDDGSNQNLPEDGVTWFGHPDYDDSAWEEGPAELGYGDGDEATVVSYGDEEDMKHITTYFRRTFEVPDATRFIMLRVRFVRDDGGAVYLNGEELFRSNLAEDADYETPSITGSGPAVESVFFERIVNADMLLTGTNVLAAEVHQRAGDSSDMSFNLELLGFDPSIGAIGVMLHPGVNRMTVRALDKTGREVDRTSVDVWFDTPTITDLPAVIGSNTTLTAADGPYRITGNTTIEPRTTLTIEPGTTVYFAQGAGLTAHGILMAAGSDDARIRFTREPGATEPWNGIQFIDSVSTSVLAYVDMDFGDGRGESITAVNSVLMVDNMTWGGTAVTSLNLTDSSWRVTNSVVPGVAADAAIRAAGIRAGGEAVLSGNRFLPSVGEGDAVEFRGASLPGPILQVLDNTFSGGEDDGLVLDGADAHVEGNTFRGFRRAAPENSSANAIITGGASGAPSIVTVARNLFIDNDHAVLLRNGSLLIGQNNTFVGSTVSAINFDEPGVIPGLGARLDGNIFFNNALVFENVTRATQLEVHRSIVPAESIDLGVGNRSEDPRFTNAPIDFRLRAGSPALGAAAHGLNMGALVQSGSAVSGEPSSPTHLTGATLSVGGPGITHYRYRVNAGPFSGEFSVDTLLVLTNLPDGEHTVHVIGKNSAGVWQAEADAAASRTWRVERGLSRLVISEVLADNRTAVVHAGAFPDLIELHNAGAGIIQLDGLSISDDPFDPAKYVFPAGISLLSGQRLVLIAGDADGSPGIHTGFALDQDGEGVYLYDQNRQLIDSVTFGPQLPDLSVGRLFDDRWGLARPTFGAANIEHRVGDRATLRINEWMPLGDRLFNDDFVELFNPDPLPVDLGGLHLTDHPRALPGLHQIAPLSFVAGAGHRVFLADGRVENGPHHVAFRLSALHEVIGLMDENLTPIDLVWYGPLHADASQGRLADGAPRLEIFSIPTPGAANELHGDVFENLITFTDAWSYDDGNVDLGTAWRETAFDDSAWTVGQGVLYVEEDPLPAPKGTELTIGTPTFYFRKHFTLNADLDRVTLTLTALLDDGAVFYLNGVEVFRLGMAEGEEIVFSTSANRQVGNADFEGPFTLDIPPGTLLEGDNLLAVEVHQDRPESGDVVMGLSLDATIAPINAAANPFRLLDHLRITELMYHAADSSLEFIELQNTGASPLALAGVRLRDGIDFEFGDVTLAPGQYIVVANDLPAFRARYGDAALVAGQFDRNLSNGGESIRLQLPAPYDGHILDFAYNDAWYPTTDGGGHSLVIRDATQPAETWGSQSAWKASERIGGSPGFAEAILGDTNGDGRVDVTDLNNVRNNFGGVGRGDANGDGRVDIDDLNAVRNNFGAAGLQAAAGPADPLVANAPRASLLRPARAARASHADLSRAAASGETTAAPGELPIRAMTATARRALRRHSADLASDQFAASREAWDVALVDWWRAESRDA